MTQEVVLVMGYPASGKTSQVKEFQKNGFENLNRDTVGGSLNDLLPPLDAFLAGGKSVVLDNTYPTVASRKPVIDLAEKHLVPVRCVFINITPEDAMINACCRMIERHGRVLGPTEKTTDPGSFPVAVIYKYKKALEKPDKAEGFSSVEKIKFVRRPWKGTNKAIILDYDGTLRITPPGHQFQYPTSPKDVVVLPNRKEVLQIWKDKGYLLLGATNQSGIAKGTVTEEDAVAALEKTNELVGHDIEYLYDSSRVPPITSYRRKPLPGMLVEHIVKHNLDPSQCIMVGDHGNDKGAAKRVEMPFVHADDFFSLP
jgi:HAD superfamily hydrolase (TIGR01662 family)